jgi:hypothetical protein
MIIKVTQADIDKCDPSSTDNNCVAVALKRIKHRSDVKAYAYLGYIRIGKRKIDMDDWPANRLIIHGAGHKIEPFEFEL